MGGWGGILVDTLLAPRQRKEVRMFQRPDFHSPSVTMKDTYSAPKEGAAKEELDIGSLI